MTTKYVPSLSGKTIEILEELQKKEQTARVRTRAHAILLSSRGFSIDEIANVFNVHRDSASSWIDAWESSGFDGLRDRPRSGRKPDLTKIEQKVAIKLIKKYPRSLKACCRKIG